MAVDLAEFDEGVAACLGEKGVLTTPEAMSGYLTDWRGRYRGQARAVLRPATTRQVSQIVALCNSHGVAIVPQSGNTGLVGGAVAQDADHAIVLSTDRLTKIRRIDARSNLSVMDAGVILEVLQNAAEEHDRLLPIDLGASGSARIGGLIATNAGGTGALRYGTMRAQVLGLEVVLPDGRVLSDLAGLRKDTSGYDLKQLFIGSEGTLGVITGAALRLWPRPARYETAFVAVPSVSAALDLLSDLQTELGDCVTSFELMSRSQVDLIMEHGCAGGCPIEPRHDWYVLVECCAFENTPDLSDRLLAGVASAMENGVVTDGVLAQDKAQAKAIWSIRHAISEANRAFGQVVAGDTSVPLEAQPAFVAQVQAMARTQFAEAKLCFVGHIGDGNIHAIAIFPPEPETAAKAARYIAAVQDIALALGGSLSAEHGLGLIHSDRLRATGQTLKLELMQSVKRVLDPKDLMNPGKLVG